MRANIISSVTTVSALANQAPTLIPLESCGSPCRDDL